MIHVAAARTSIYQRNGCNKVHPRYLCIHDASPKFQNELELIFKKMSAIEAANKFIAVVPNWGEKWDIRKYPNFLNLIKEQEKLGWKIVLHGYSHTAVGKIPWFGSLIGSNECWEFYSLDYHQAKFRLKSGIDVFYEAFGYRPQGFIAPNWLLSSGAKRALMEFDFKFQMSFSNVHYFGLRREFALIDHFHLRSTVLNEIFGKILKLISNGNHVVIHPTVRGESILSIENYNNW